MITVSRLSVVKMAHFFLLVPFFSLFPTQTDVQPFAFILILICFFLYRTNLYLSKLDIIFFLVAVWSTIYITSDTEVYQPRKALGALLAFSVYMFYKRFGHFLSAKIVFWVVLFNFIVLLFHYLFPSLYVISFGNFVRTVKIVDFSGARGASGLASEPAFTSAIAIFYMAVLLYLKEFNGERYLLGLSMMCCLAMLLLTKAGSGVLLLVIFFMLQLFKLRFDRLLASLVLGAGCILIIFQFDFGRLSFILENLFKDPALIFSVDASVGARVLNILIGFIAVFEWPFGWGVGSYNVVAEYIYLKYSLGDFVAGRYSNISAFAKYSVEIGAIFWMLILGLLCRAVYNVGVKVIPFVIVSIFFLAGSFSIVFPPIWYFLALNKRRDHEST